MILQSKRDRTNWIKSSACSPNSYQWGIRLTQGMPTSCGRADPIPADYTACRGHLSEADTHLIPIGEGAGFRPEYKIVRSHLMLKYANQLRNHPQFIDVTAEFQNAKGISLADYEALCFGLFAKCVTLSPEDLQNGASAFTFREHNFHSMAIPKESVALFLREMTTTPELLSARIKQRDYGSNDFTELRKRPLISASRGYLPIDLLFLAEKFESGPFWAINDISRNMGEIGRASCRERV